MSRFALAFLFASVVTTTAAARSSIALAPFTTTGADASLGYGVAHELSARLHGLPEINVVSERQVSAAWRELGLTANKIDLKAAERLGRQLGADVLVLGSLQQKKDGLDLVLTVYRPLSGAPSETKQARGPGVLELQELAAPLIAELAGVPALAPPSTQSAPAALAFYAGLKKVAEQSLGPRAADASVPSALAEADLAKAASAFERAVAADPALAEAHAGLAVVRALAGDFAEAQQSLAKATRGPLSVLGVAFVAMRQGRFDDAAKGLEAAVVKEPGFLHARGTLGQLYNHFGRFREAKKTFTSYSEVAPKQPWVRAQIGYTLARQHKFDDAVRVTQEALALVPDSPDLLVELASRYIDAGKYADAAAKLTAALALAPKDGRLLVRLGYVRLLEEKDTDAIKVTEKALKLLDPARQRKEMAYAHLNLTRAWGHLGQYDVALEQMGFAKKAGLADCSELDNDVKLTRFRTDPRYDKAKF